MSAAPVNFTQPVLYSGPGLMPITSGGGSFGQILFPIKTGVELINDSIYQILMTNPGERWMRPTFGAGLNLLLFETVPMVMQRLAQAAVVQAVAAIDPRIQVTSVSISTSQYTVSVNYIFRIIQVGLNGAGFIEFPRSQ
jgi:phage baseplate assembly protein W